MTGLFFFLANDERECVWLAVCGWHVSNAGAETSLWEDARQDDMWGKRYAVLEDSQAFPPRSVGGSVHRVHGQSHWMGECLCHCAQWWKVTK